VLDKVTPELALQLAERVKATVLDFDDTLRDCPEALEFILDAAHSIKGKALARLTISQQPPPARPPQAPASPLDGLTLGQAAELATINREQAAHSAQLMARRQLSAVLPMVEAEARKLGLAFTAEVPGAVDALKLCLVAYREAWLDVNRRDAGEPVAPVRARAADARTPTPPNTSSKVLRDVFDRWKTSGAFTRSEDSVKAMDRALKQFEGQHQEVTLLGITREMGDAYRSWLRENCGTPKTARDRLTAIKTLLRYACRELEWTSRHTWEGLDIKAPTTNKRRQITSDEMGKLFGTTLHAQYELPKAKQGGQDAAYWIPLLGAFTGARLGELCQLRTADVQVIDGIHALVLTDDGEGQRIKTAAGHRTIPIHSELVRLGFLGYAEAMRNAGNDSLWPAMPMRPDKPSDYFGRWFRAFRDEAGLSGPDAPTFHYFRHTVRPLMRRGGIDSMVRDLVTGHETRGSIGDVVYDGLLLEDLKPAIEAIKYPTLRLPVVSPHASL